MRRTCTKREIGFFIVLILFCTARCLFRCFPDYDLWNRLIVGSAILDGFLFMREDIFSYIPAAHPLIDHEWGASVIFYSVFKFFHQNGLLFLKCLVNIGTMFLIYKTIALRKPKSAPPYNLFLYALAFMAASYVLCATIRCQIFSFFFFALFLYLLEKTRSGEFKHWWLFPLITVFWINIHAGCVAGIGMIFLYLIGEKLNGKKVDFYLKAFISSCLVTLITPLGLEFVLFLFKSLSMNREMISEWQSTFNSSHSYIYFKIYFFLMTFTAFYKLIKTFILKQNTDWTKWIVFAVVFYLSVAHMKHQPLFVFATMILFYDDFYEVLRDYSGKISDKITEKMVAVKEFIVYGAVIALSMVMLLPYHHLINLTYSDYPYRAIEFIRINNLRGNLFTPFKFGSYAAYKLFPYNKIGLDGRFEILFEPDLYYASNNFFLKQGEHWADIIEVYPPDLLLIEKNYPVYDTILNMPEWALAFEDNSVGVFVSAKLKKDSYLQPSSDREYYEKNMFGKNFEFSKRAERN
ncbi:hypothetical protein IKQ26_00610 [bacterium]|nr:hypothetical protein [bacterium]